MKNISTIMLWALALSAGFASCKKAFDLKPGTELDASQMYRNVFDADAAVTGLYGKFMNLADRYIILNELRGDLLSPTNNADESLREISSHNVSENNPYASPKPFYELIINCNDVLKNFIIMRQNKALKEAEFDQRYSDVACLRSFLYLQLGIHYGDQVRYVTQPLENVDAIKDSSAFRQIPFDALLDSLIIFTESLPFKDQYPTGTSLNIILDGYSTQKFYINKRCLLGELHLWKGNYLKAAEHYRIVMETATIPTQGENHYSQYKLGWSGGANLYVDYTRDGDASTLVYSDGWRTMFEATDERFNREWIWALPFDNKFKPENPLIKLFSPIGGNYLVKPSDVIMEKWDNQEQRPVTVAGSLNGIPYDARGLFSVKDIGGQRVAMKFLYNYINYATNTPNNALLKNGKWFLYRQTNLHLHFAEAANRDGFRKLAYSLFNSGIKNTYTPAVVPADKTKIQNTVDSFHPRVYQFDAREGDIPYFRGDWYRNLGIRQRAFVKDYRLTATSVSDSLIQIENGLIEEGALENAFEGNRWPDLLRIALRRNDPSFLANKIFDKLSKEGNGNAAIVRDRLSSKENWYLPFKW